MYLSLEIAKQTLMQVQTSIGVTTNNISNSQVDGYTRQRVNLTSNISISKGGQLVGTGATISSIDRLRTGFYDKQYRENLGVYSNSSATTTALERIESIIGSLDGDTGIKTTINNFYDSLEELSKNPEKTGIKQIVRDNAVAMTQAFNSVAGNLNTMKEQYASYTESQVTSINNALKNLQAVNDEIGRLSATGQTPNDLLDERDRLIDFLSERMDISIINSENNKVNIISNGEVLVQDGFSSELTYTVNANGSLSVKYASGKDFSSKGGELASLINTVNSKIPEYENKLNLLANDMVTALNKIHATGQDAAGNNGVPLFTGTTAGTIAVSQDILNDPSLILTSTDGAPGNNDVILSLIATKDGATIDGNTFGVVEYLDNLSASISAETNASKTKTANYKYITDEVYVMRANEIGVNEDEEIIKSVQLQQTFAAASKIISTLNTMFDSLISAV